MSDEMRWQAIDHDQFVDITPVDDAREHELGDECWCTPRVDRSEARPMIIHSSADRREVFEQLMGGRDE